MESISHDKARWIDEVVPFLGRMVEIVAGGQDCLDAVDCGCDSAVEGAGHAMVGRIGRRKVEMAKWLAELQRLKLTVGVWSVARLASRPQDLVLARFIFGRCCAG